MIVIESCLLPPTPTAIFRSQLAEVFKWSLSAGNLWLPNYERVNGVYVPIDLEPEKYNVVGHIWYYAVGIPGIQEVRQYSDGREEWAWTQCPSYEDWGPLQPSSLQQSPPHDSP